MSPFRSICLLIALFFSAASAFSQNGGPLLSHYRESTEIENQSWAICQDENKVMLFANIRGILTFDGQTWGNIRIPVIPYTLKFNKTEKRVFIGGDNNYGYLKRDEKGFYRFISLKTDSSAIGIISRIVFTDSTVWFYGDRNILEHDIKTGKLKLKLGQRHNNLFTGMFSTPKNIFIDVDKEGLFRLEADTLFPIVTGYLLEHNEVLFELPYNREMVLLGLGDGSLSLFDGIKFYPYPVKDNGYLKDNSLSEGIEISDSLYAFATLDGGAMIVERKSGAVRSTVNYLTGLPDEEVFAIGSDHNNGLWISHLYGLTRVELLLPVADLVIYPGLKGNLISSVWHNKELYVATSEGVFYLSEVRNYSETQVLVKKEPGTPGPSVQVPGEVRKTRRSLFARIFGKKYSPEDSSTFTRPEGITGRTVASETVYERKTVSRLKSVDYLYRKVEGIAEKCRQLLSTPDGLLASTVKGLYIISGHSAQTITSERNINFISRESEDGRYYVATSEGYFYLKRGPGGWVSVSPDKSFTLPLYSIVPVGNNTIWAGGDEIAVKIINGVKSDYRIYNIRADYPQRCKVTFTSDTLFVMNSSGIEYFSNEKDSFLKYPGIITSDGQKFDYLVSQSGALWIRQDQGWICIDNRSNLSRNDVAVVKIFDNIISLDADENTLLVVTGDNQVYRIERNRIGSVKPGLDLFVRSVQNDKGLYFNISRVEFDRGDNNVYFDIVAPGYQKRNSVQYQYFVDGMMDNWSKWSTQSSINLMLPHGTYDLRVRAKDIWGNVSDIRQLTFTIKTPFTQTTLFYMMLLAVSLTVVVLVVRFRERQLQRDKHLLEEKVKERTAEIEAQKQEITSSIEYAGRIQQALLPMKEIFAHTFSEHFIIFRPRDIVSGDFYWIGEDGKHVFFTVADCTGHGVPGAFMSTLGISTLNEIITNKSDLHAHSVLNLLRTKIKTSLHQTGKEGEAADGMDIAFCVLHKDRKKLEFAGAYNPLIISQGAELKEYKADRMPIGIYVGEKDSFTNFEINVTKGDIIYLFSDGMADQFGGPDGSKYKKSSLKKLLASVSARPLQEQSVIIEEEFEKWRGTGEQIDDVTVIGVKI